MRITKDEWCGIIKKRNLTSKAILKDAPNKEFFNATDNEYVEIEMKINGVDCDLELFEEMLDMWVSHREEKVKIREQQVEDEVNRRLDWEIKERYKSKVYNMISTLHDLESKLDEVESIMKWEDIYDNKN